MTDLSAWLTKTEAARRLQVSEKTVDRMADRNQLERRLRQRPGKKPEPVFDPEPVDRLASERTPAIAPAETTMALATRPGVRGDPVPAIAQAIADAIAQTLAPRPRQCG